MHLKSKTRKNFGLRSVYVAVLDFIPSTSGAPGAARTRNLLIRSQALCPIELRGRFLFEPYFNIISPGYSCLADIPMILLSSIPSFDFPVFHVQIILDPSVLGDFHS